MANVSVYTDPGSYISEVIEPGSISVSSQRVLGIVAIAPRTRQYTDEAIIRGKIYDEALSVEASSPHTAWLANPCNRDRNSAILYMNGTALGLGDWSFNPAVLQGAAVGTTVDTSTNVNFTISVDRKAPITIVLGSNAAKPLTEIRDEINAALLASSVYGAAYSSVASTITTDTQLVLTSPSSSSISDIKIFLSLENDAANTIGGAGGGAPYPSWTPSAAAGVQAPTQVLIVDDLYFATAEYTIEYVSIDTVADPLSFANSTTPLIDITQVGSFPGSVNYSKNQDFAADTAAHTVKWDVATYWANASALATVAENYTIVTGTNDKLYIELNGLGILTVTFGAGAKTAAEMATAINTAFAASSAYGPLYAHVASDASGYVQFDVPAPFENYPTAKGWATTITFYDDDGTGTGQSVFSTLFGTGTSLPWEVRGTGQRPDFGTVYYATYNAQRPDSDYATPHRVYNPTQLYEYTSPLTLSNYPRNKLAIAGEIAFENEATSLYLIQINDQTAPGLPTQTQINSAIDVAKTRSGITDVVVIDTSQDSAVYLMNHVANQSSQLEKHYRRGWYGMARDTDVGDPDTADTFVYRATRTLQPGNTSPGRGRQILVSPANVDRVITLNDGREITLELDGSYLAAAVAGLYTSLPSPSDVLINRSVTGFVSDTFETFLRGERHTMASNGVTVVTNDAGNLKMLDPLTTEAGGGKVVQFEEPSASAQKDAVVGTVNTLIENNAVGVVPDDLADFIADTKKWIMLGILAEINAGTIAPFRNPDGTVRDIDPRSDIQVFQSTTDQRTFFFKFWFNLKYPAKRFFGEFSVDNPFFAVAA